MKSLKEGKPLKLAQYSPGLEFVGNLIFMYNPKHGYFEKFGFSSANYTHRDLLESIFINPENWKLATSFKDTHE